MKPILILKAAVGFVVLLLGTIGLFIPVFPTTPFILLALACFSGMPRVRSWLLKNKLLREYYERYKTGKRLSRKTVITSLGFLWFTLILSALVAHDIAMAVALLVIGVFVTIHILMLARHKRTNKSSEDI